ncbi:MAG: hypothetical protein ABI835_18435, partial [Chloroflexota bacterium]
FLGFFGVIVGGTIGILGSYFNTHATLNAQQRKARQDYLTSRMDILARALSEYEMWLAGLQGYTTPLFTAPEAKDHARIIGQAIAACLAVNDLPAPNDLPDSNIHWQDLPDLPYHSAEKVHVIHRLAYIANRRLTRNFVTAESLGAGGDDEIKMWGHYTDRNRAALDHGVKRLAQLIDETQQ